MMKPESGLSVSIWMETEKLPVFAALSEDVNTEVCVVGAGITGLTIAYMLCLEGRKVVVVDDGKLAGGETQRTTAHLTAVLDYRYFEIERMHGKENARLAYQSHSAAIDRIESIIREEQIECQFERLDGYLFLGEDQKVDLLDKELDACKRAGFLALEIETLAFGHARTRPALRFPRQARFHVLKYLNGLIGAIQRHGGLIYCGCHIDELKDGPRVLLRTGDGQTIRCQKVVYATSTPVSDCVAMHTKQAPYRTYVIGCQVKKGSIKPALYWDTEEPYHYVRMQEIDGDDEYEYLIAGGEDHKTGQEDDAEERYCKLEKWTLEMFPEAGAPRYRWSGQVFEPVDGLGFIGKDPAHGDNVFISTGASGNGMTHGTISGILMADLVAGRQNDWADLYDPSRKTLGSAGEFLRENLNVAAQYLDHFKGGDVQSIDEIAPGQGAVVKVGDQKVAVYKNERAEAFGYSAVCPHLKAIVNWNTEEKSWDCPAHGSRFDRYGQVISGPSNADLCGIDAAELIAQEPAANIKGDKDMGRSNEKKDVRESDNEHRIRPAAPAKRAEQLAGAESCCDCPVVADGQESPAAHASGEGVEGMRQTDAEMDEAQKSSRLEQGAIDRRDSGAVCEGEESARQSNAPIVPDSHLSEGDGAAKNRPR